MKIKNSSKCEPQVLPAYSKGNSWSEATFYFQSKKSTRSQQSKVETLNNYVMILIKGIEEINCIFGNGATSDELITYFNEF